MSGFGFTDDGKTDMNTSTNRLSIVLITYNSQKYLDRVLSSCLFADEIVIVDSNSSDQTIQIAQKYKAKIYQEDWMGFGRQKQRAVDLAKNRWVFVLDSDEVISDKLQKELLNLLEKPKYSAYFVPRLNCFFGKPVKRCGLYPDYTIRLFDKKEAKFSDDEVHEKVVIEKNKTSYLKNYMIHFAYENVEEFITKQNRYSTLNSKPNRLKALINPPWTFFRLYILKLGFLEGWRGFVIAKLYAQYTFWKYIKKSF